jgi:catechol 2,3-dioxygenase-like lactoylglutathione lyase family enzyme
MIARMLADTAPTAFVPSTDLARSRRFFEDVLGLEVLHADSFACALRSGDVTIRVTHVGPTLRAQPFTVLGWEVTDVAAQVRELAARGVEFLAVEGLEQDADRIWTAPGGTLVAWFTDPDGNTLSLHGHGQSSR